MIYFDNVTKIYDDETVALSDINLKIAPHEFVSIVGHSGAGKSTLLNTLTNSKSKVGNYNFTTLEPHLGDMYGIVIADIPGIIEGAAEGKGLGHYFLRHIERNSTLLFLVPADADDIKKEYEPI
jgi:GTP-binding protein